MSYPRSLDEYTDEEIVLELARRCGLRWLNQCDYCRRPNDAPARCRSENHGRTAAALRNQLVEYGVTAEPAP